jgi:hypothetical protein
LLLVVIGCWSCVWLPFFDLWILQIVVPCLLLSLLVACGNRHPASPGMAERMKMFRWSREDLSTLDQPPEKYQKNGNRGNGGWTTKRSFSGLVRRLLHAMTTQDTFTVVLGGHNAAQGEG